MACTIGVDYGTNGALPNFSGLPSYAAGPYDGFELGPDVFGKDRGVLNDHRGI